MQASKSKLHAHRFIWEDNRRFRVQMAQARCFSLIAHRLCVLQNRNQPQNARTRTCGRCTGETPFSLEKKVRITASTLLPAPIMCRKLSKRCKLPENRGFRFLLYTIPADMSKVKHCSCSGWSTVTHLSAGLQVLQQLLCGYLYSHAEDYREFAVPAIDEMVRQTRCTAV